MSLTITLARGSVFNIGDLEVLVSEVHSSSDFSLLVGGVSYPVDEDHWTTLAPGVAVRAPFPRQGQRKKLRIQIEAPGFFVTRNRSLK